MTTTLIAVIISAAAVLPLLLACHCVAEYGRRHGLVHTDNDTDDGERR